MATSDRLARPDGGSTLILVMVLVLVMGGITVALLGGTTANFAHSNATNRLQSQLTAVDAGINTAIQMVRKTPGLCTSTNPTVVTLPATTTMNGSTATLTCALTATGSVPSDAGSWAVYLTNDVAGAVRTQNAANSPNKIVTGPVYVATGNWDLQAALTVIGDVVQPQPNCTNPGASLTVTAPFGRQCVSAAIPVPPATQPLPATVPAVAPARIEGACDVLSPGLYDATNAAQITDLGQDPTYLQSGVYVLNNVGRVRFRNGTTVAGKPRDGSNPVAGLPALAATAWAPCTAAATADPNANGVMFVLAGDSWLDLDNQADVAMHTFVGPTSTNPVGTSVRQLVATDPAAWITAPMSASTRTDDVLLDGSGADGSLAIYGNVYTPHGGIALSATNQSAPKLTAGVVAADIELNAAASSASGPTILSPTNLPAPTSVVLRATATGVGGEKTVTATAVVRISTDPARVVTIDSWTLSDS